MVCHRDRQTGLSAQRRAGEKTRRLSLPEVPPDRHELPLAWFNDQKRVVRFIAFRDDAAYSGQAEMAPVREDNPGGDEPIYLQLWFDGQSTPARTEEMMQTGSQTWESVFMIPNGIAEIGYHMGITRKQSPEHYLEEIANKGNKIIYKMVEK